MRATIYSRVSDDDQRERRSVGEQEAECREDCAEQSWDVVKAFCDNDRSASRFTKKSRPGYDELQDFLRTGEADVLVLWESSRGDRELERWAGLLNLCRRMGILIRVVTHRRTYDLSVPRDWRTLAEDGVDSAYESEKTRERVMRAVGKNAIAGRPHGKLLFGYRRVYDARGKFVAQEVAEDQARVIREAAERVASGQSCYSIANDFNSRGITTPTGSAWDLTQVKRVVRNPGYIGKRVHQGKIVGDAVWPAILDEELYWRVDAILTDPSRKTNTDRAIKHLLTGLALCGVCESAMKVQNNRGSLAYQCPNGFHVSVRTSALEEYVTKKVKERLFRLDVTEIAHPQADERRAAARRELAELQERLDGFTREAALGKLSAPRLGEIERELQPLILNAQRAAHAPKGKTLLYRLVENPYLWDDCSMKEKRRIVADLFTIHVDTIGRGRRSYNIEDRVRIEAAL